MLGEPGDEGGIQLALGARTGDGSDVTAGNDEHVLHEGAGVRAQGRGRGLGTYAVAIGDDG